MQNQLLRAKCGHRLNISWRSSSGILVVELACDNQLGGKNRRLRLLAPQKFRRACEARMISATITHKGQHSRACCDRPATDIKTLNYSIVTEIVTVGSATTSGW
jgi:hypothetical protein